MGEGQPSVVLESSLSTDCLDWCLIQPEVAKFTRVYAYDRAGLGWSDPSPDPRTPEVIASELHRLLVNADVSKPYILVGFSIGGVYVRYYASQYPNEIAGIVLVDGAHEQQRGRLPTARQKVLDAITAENVSILQEYAEMTHEEIVREVQANRPPDTPSHLPADVQPFIFFDRMRPYIAKAKLEEYIAAETTLNQKSKSLPVLGDISLVHLTAGARKQYPGVTDELHEEGERVWVELQREIAATSSRSTHQIVEGSSHQMVIDKPEVVVEAILSLVENWRTQSGMK
jgi:pimeloyl-ACP methyl ester carboxylesterase